MKNFKESGSRPNSYQKDWMRRLDLKNQAELTNPNQQTNGLVITYTTDAQGKQQMNIQINNLILDVPGLCNSLADKALLYSQELNKVKCEDELGVLAINQSEKSVSLPIKEEKVQIGGTNLPTQLVDASFGPWTRPMDIISEQQTSLNTTNVVVGVALLSAMAVLIKIGGGRSRSHTSIRTVSHNISRPQKVVEPTKTTVTEKPKKYEPDDEVVAAAIEKIGERYGKNVDDPMVRLFARTTQAEREKILQEHFKAAPELAERAIKEFRQFIGLHGLDAGKWMGSAKWRKQEDAEYNISRGSKAIDKADELIMKYFFKIIGFR